MTARRCFNAKIATGKVAARAGQQLLDMLADFEADARSRLGDTEAAMRAAAHDASAEAMAAAARRADNVRRAVRVQGDILRRVNAVEKAAAAARAAGEAPWWLKGDLRSTAYNALSSALETDASELAPWGNVEKLAKFFEGQAHQDFRDAIAKLRPGKLGFDSKAAVELDFLRGAFGDKGASAWAQGAAKAFADAEGRLADHYIDAGGELAKRANYFPNPSIDAAKARALGEANFKALVRANVDRDKVLDFNTGERMGDAKFERLLAQAWTGIDKGETGAPSSAFKGRGPLSDARTAPRLFHMQDAESWLRFADAVGEHASAYSAAVDHFHLMARDTAMLRHMGPDPAATLRFMNDILDREPGRLAVRATDTRPQSLAAAVKANRKIDSQIAGDKVALRNLFLEVSGTRGIGSPELARRAADLRSLAIGAQLGSTLITALNDPGTALMTARFNGLPMMTFVRWFMHQLTTPGSETFAAQMGMIMDHLAHAGRALDTVMGDTIRSGIAAKIGSAVIRASGLRKWTEAIRQGYGLGTMAHLATERVKAFGDLDPALKSSLERYGIGEQEWKIFGQAAPSEPRPGASFLSPRDVMDLGGGQAQAAAEKLSHYINSVLDYALLAHPNARLRAKFKGDSQKGTFSGEVRASMGMYRSWTGGMIYLHGAQMLARGWDGSRLGHAAATFATVTLLGALSMQIKQVAAGRDLRTLDLSSDGMHSWAAAMLQGGGLGLFGDILAVDKTKYGNSWAAALAGPLASAFEDVGGKLILGNAEKFLQGKPTSLGPDALYVGARYLPGSSLWYAKLAFQRAVVDQLAKMIDPRAPERFAHIESEARKGTNQQYWWRPGQAAPGR
jgi:hypothetical protein